MRRFKDNTATASRNIRYNKSNTSSSPLYIICWICGNKMYIDKEGISRCPNCDNGKNVVLDDSQVF